MLISRDTLPSVTFWVGLILCLTATALAALPEVGVNDFRISYMGPPLDADYDAFYPTITFNEDVGEYFVVWLGKDTSSSWDIYARRIDGSSGALLGADSELIASGVYTYAEPDVAYNGSDEYLVVFEKDLGGDLAIYGVFVDAATGTPDGSPFLIAQAGSSGSGLYAALTPAVVYNPLTYEYLVVHAGDLNPALFLTDVYCTRVWRDVSSTHTVGPIQISDLGPVTPTAGYESTAPDVACDSYGYYLVVWRGNDSGPYESEVFGQRLDSLATPVGVDDFPISQMGTTSSDFGGEPAVVYNAIEDEFLVTFWGRKSDEPGGSEIFVQRLTSGGVEVGIDDQRISDMGPAGSYAYMAYAPTVSWMSDNNEYLVTWYADDDENGMVDDEYEVFGQFLSGANASEISPNDMRLSDMGPDGDPDYRAERPAVAANPDNGSYLTVWSGDTFMLSTIANNEFEIFGQQLRAATIFSDDFESGGSSGWGGP